MTGAEEARARAHLDAVGLRLMRQTGNHDGREIWEVACKACGVTLDVVLSVFLGQPGFGCHVCAAKRLEVVNG